MSLLLTPRLKTIAESITGFDTVADIGSDHAYLPIYLVKNKQVKAVLATDINKGPVRIAKARVADHNAGDRIKVRQGDGLQPIMPGEVEVIVIAGMGGLLIRDILDRDPTVARSVKRLVLQPMRDSDKLRRWLLENSYEISDEELVKEQDKIYEILWAVPVEEPQEAKGLMLVGDRIIKKKHPLLGEFIKRKTYELQKVMAALEDTDSENCRARAAECRAMLDFYRGVAEWVR